MPGTRTIGSFIERSWIPTLTVTLAVTAWIVFVGEGIDAYYRSRLVDMVHGTAYRPYVYRVLVPGLARLGTLLLPATVAAPEHIAVISIMYASLVGFAAGVRALSRTVFTAPPIVHEITALGTVAFLPLTFGPFSRQIYDFTTLCLVTWALVFLARRQWIAFALTFVAGCLNKESTILLTLVYIVHVMRTSTGLSKTGAAALFIYQLAAFALVRAAVVYAFRDNPGDTVEVHLFGHNQYVLLHPTEISKRLLLLIALAFLGVRGWKDKPPLLRHAMTVLGPALMLMGVTVGMVDEIRAYYEIYAVLVLMAAHTICRALGIPIVSVASGDGRAGASA
jgi:hypothetical protein